MEDKHPKVLIGLGVLVVAVIATGFIPASWFGIQPAPVVINRLNIDTSPKAEDFSSLNKDTNSDGVADWRALVAKSYQNDMAHNIASGTPINTSSKVDAKAAARLNDPNNLTVSFAKNMYVAGSYIKQNNITDKDAQNDIVASIMQEEKAKIQVKTYEIKDIKVAAGDDSASQKAYGNNLGAAMQKAIAAKVGEGDLDPLNEFSAKKNPAVLAPLVKKRDILGKVIQTLLVMQVPQSATAYHTLALNRISAYYTILDSFSKADSDPLRASLSLGEYAATMKSMFGSINNFRQYFTDNKIVFSSSDPGYFFNPITP